MTQGTALIAITRRGAALACRVASELRDATIVVPARHATGLASGSAPVRILQHGIAAEVGDLFARHARLVFFVAVGAVVRLIAPHLKDKERDPAVIVIDEAGRFAIPVLSGHVGGANACAEQLAAWLGATAVVTTAAEVSGTIAVDVLGRDLGWKIEAPKVNLTEVAARLVDGEPVAIVQEAGSRAWWTRPVPLPANITMFDRFEDLDPSTFAAVLWVTRRSIPASLWRELDGRLVVYRPPEYGVMLGVGCDRDTPDETLRVALDEALTLARVDPAAVRGIATIDRKRDEACILDLARAHGWPLHFFSAAELAAIPVPNPSAIVLQHLGTPSVAEAAALSAAHADLSYLLVEKHKHRGVDGRSATISIARIPSEE